MIGGTISIPSAFLSLKATLNPQNAVPHPSSQVTIHERMQRQPASYSISDDDLKSGGFPLCHTTAAKLHENGEAESP
ncbi:unnamed protein product [Brassica napus]|uniref:(rape) hypothetical protein n=1 Tax=Brassica napus TaxID=3708 RepID=A0A817AYD9_BRANA|nr:unnamed protein product [Brassica napus]CAF2327400.1 unnamed protein product [Brassica napus]